MENKREMNNPNEVQISLVDEQSALENEAKANIEAVKSRVNEVPVEERADNDEYIEFLENQIVHKIAKYQNKRASEEMQKYFVICNSITSEEVNSLTTMLESNPDEATVHQFLKDNPKFLVRALVGGRFGYLISKPRLGADFVPDFLIAEENSMGLQWFAVELESPRIKAHRGNGLDSHELTHAIGQIKDWRSWIMNNLDYARRSNEQKGLGLIGIDDKVTGLILIGRRTKYPERFNDFRRQKNVQERIKVQSYDWLVDLVSV